MLEAHGDIALHNLSGTTVQADMADGKPNDLLLALEPSSVSLIVLHGIKTFKFLSLDELYAIVGQGICALRPHGQLVLVMDNDDLVDPIIYVSNLLQAIRGLRHTVVCHDDLAHYVYTRPNTRHRTPPTTGLSLIITKNEIETS